MRFLADVGISRSVVAWLRAQGHDAVHLSEQSLHRLSDDAILRKARDEQRIVLTHDLDMGRLLAGSRDPLPSIITFRLADMRPNSVIARIEPVLRAFTEDLLAGAAVTVTDRNARSRRLPI